MFRRKLKFSTALLAIAAIASVAYGGNLEIKKYILFGGSNTDSTEQVSTWIPVRGASRIFIQTRSSKAAFHASTDADSTFTDSIAVFKVAFTDTISNVNPIVGADSVVITSTIVTNVDTTSKMVMVAQPPLHEELRSPANANGITTWIMPVTPGLATADNNGVIVPQYMRVLITPRRRMTVTGGQSTAGKRVNGLKGLRMDAYVVRTNN